MPRTVFFTAVVVALIGAIAFSGSAGADHIAGQEPYFSCKASVARVTLLNQALVPTIEPLAANANKEECAEDTAGLPTVALPPSPNPAPVLSATAVQAKTEILCAGDDPNPAVDPADNDVCDAGRRSFEQQVLSTADAADVHIVVGSGASAIDITAQAANSSARASCAPNNVPVLGSTSNVVNLVVRIGGTVIPITVPQANQEQVINLGIAKLILNERVGAEGARPNATSGELTRRAIHLQVPGDPAPPVTSPAAGSVADVVVAESTADFHGGVCQTSSSAGCPPGAVRDVQGQCVITSVRCPSGTTFDPTALACIESALGGRVVPINRQLREFFRGSPCIGRGFGRLVAVIGTNGPDRITGTNRSDRIFALAGNDRVSGGRGNDCVEGGRGRDVIDGSNGNDTLLGGTGRDQVSGGPGNDRMRGGGGRDRLNGGYGNDRLVGGAGNDGISTGNGRDRAFGGAGNDIINAAIRGPAAFVDCGPGKDRVRINKNELRRTRNCELVDITRRMRSRGR